MSDPIYEAAKIVCELYMESEDYKSGAYKKKDTYQMCCEVYSFCSFWAQSWFWYLCGGLILLAIIGSIVGSVLCCCRGRGRGGTDQSIDEEASEPSDQSQKP
ncbi:hypothetical protein B9Z55_007867 [Caenorhabditis nigoni]|uniref:Uncharacterized protein n=1 Tax=Caenorhabditis nigoni TaxID=1611254 RepID=A0A2G5VBK5_9PELO|nr:hypothetical protein B9Z55_007867 [Caenorhabditis nigoni]